MTHTKRVISHYIIFRITGIMLISFLFSCKKDSDSKDDVIIITASGDISAKMDQFRQLLGSQLNTTPDAVGGRREIDWDGVPDDLLGKTLPGDFFNPVGPNAPLGRQRGLAYASNGEFMVTNNNFATINQEAATQFSAFSGTKTFSNISSSLWDVLPQKPGTNVAATVKGFGIVFSDVDVASSTFLEFFDNDQSLGKFFAPTHDNSTSFSFVGVYFKNKKVTRIQVGHDGVLSGGGKDITNGGTKDLVIMDNFLYDEPVAK
jgi:hypothetical protein